MRVLFLSHGFNSLTQRLLVELGGRGHEVSIELDIADSVAEEAVALFRPEVIVAPYLRRKIPESIFARHLCLVVHPGIAGDRGPSALDWAIQEGEREWGVTVLAASEVMDGGPVWAEETFALAPPGQPPPVMKKSSLYRNQVTEAAVGAVLSALDRFAAGGFSPRTAEPGAPGVRGRARPLMKQEDRAIDWRADDTLTVLRKIAAADGFPGVRDELLGTECFLHDARPGPPAAATSGIEPGQVIGRAPPAGGPILRATSDGAIWIGHVRRPAHRYPFKLPVQRAFAAELAALPAPLPLIEGPGADPIRIERDGPVAYVHADLYNGALSTELCQRLQRAWEQAAASDARVLVLLGGADFFGNGIHLHVIEAADSPADESMRNIEAMDDLALAILTTARQLTVSTLRGNAGAGGAFLALCADQVWARRGVILNPHYKNMGNLYGSEYWTYSLPRRVGEARARELVEHRLPIGAAAAEQAGLVDACFGDSLADFERQLRARAAALATAPDFGARLLAKLERRRSDEARRPLREHRAAELLEMRRNFYGFDPSYHYARHHFVHKVPLAFTPRHLARHRELATAPPRRTG